MYGHGAYGTIPYGGLIGEAAVITITVVGKVKVILPTSDRSAILTTMQKDKNILLSKKDKTIL